MEKKCKIVGMIPARLGSHRVPKKNLRLLCGRPLIAYIIETALASKAFDELYINSEAQIFSEIANMHKIKFYQRPVELSTNETSNDEFAYDFIKNVKADILVQLLPTSPLITPEEINGFVNLMLSGNYDTLISVRNNQIASLYQGKPINFSVLEPHRPSQTMVPVQPYATVLMAWTHESFIKNMQKYGCAYHGGETRIGYYLLKGLSTIDIDEEDDFNLAEVAVQYRENCVKFKKEYYNSKNGTYNNKEIEVSQIMKNDGVVKSDFENENKLHVCIEELIASNDNSKSWSHRLINSENNSAILISQLPGEGNRRHYHPDWNEWWYIIEGEYRCEVGDNVFEVKKGDVVFIEKNKLHIITAIGETPAVRLAVSKDLVEHVYTC